MKYILLLLFPLSLFAQNGRQANLSFIAVPATTGTINVYRASTPCDKQNITFKLLASGVKGTSDSSQTKFSYADTKVAANQTYCYYGTISGGATTFPPSGYYNAVFSTKVVVFQ